MKKIYLSVLFAGLMAICAQAQMFVGGSVGASYVASKSTYSSTTVKGPANLSFEFNPMLGYDLSEKMGIGVMLNLGFSTTDNRRDDPTKRNSLIYGASPFLRNVVLYSGNLSLLLETQISFLGVNSKISQGSTSLDLPKTFAYGLSVAPILSYSLTDRLSLETRVNLLRFGIGQVLVKDDDDKDTITFFGFGINPSEISSSFNDMDISVLSNSPIEIGMVFRF